MSYQVTTTLNHAIAGKGFFQKGINGSITLENGKLAYKAIAKLDPEIQALDESIKTKVAEYNKRLDTWKKAHPDEEQVPVEMVVERDALSTEVDKIKENSMKFDLGDDQYRALCTVIESAVNVVYKTIQKQGDGTLEKDEKAPNLAEFQWLQAFEEDVKNADKVKGKE